MSIKRQQMYIRAIYDSDQEAEAVERALGAAYKRNRPADEWRWLKYGYDEYGNPMPLLARIEDLKLIDKGTGSSFAALESRELILMRYEQVPFADPIPYVRITAKGRKLVRFATQEVRPNKPPAGTLKEWHWKALVMVYSAHLNVDVGIRAKYGYGDYGDLSWNTWLRIQDYKYRGEYNGLVEEYEFNDTSRTDWHSRVHVIQITAFGLEFYANQWTNYRALYPDIYAPEPNPLGIEKVGFVYEQ